MRLRGELARDSRGDSVGASRDSEDIHLGLVNDQLENVKVRAVDELFF